MKRCGCTDPGTGRRLGNSCPRLRRGPGGPWSASHGTWCLQLELPTPKGVLRRQFRRAGFPTSTAAQTVLDEARALLALAPRDPDLTLRIAQLLHELPPKQALPTPQTVVRKLRAGPVDGVTVLVGAYLDDWLAEPPLLLWTRDLRERSSA